MDAAPYSVVALIAAALLIPSIAQAAPKLAVKKWTAFLPPLQYDYPYQGQLTLIRGNLAVMNAACLEAKAAMYPIPYACAIVYRRADTSPTAPGDLCHVFIAEDDLLRGWVYKDVLRHELGHCNGWKGHAGGRLPPALPGKPPKQEDTVGTSSTAVGIAPVRR
jgi:hypothetical protein